MKLTKFILLACAAFAAVSGVAHADSVALTPRQVPAKTVPVPDDVSPELQKLIAAPYNPNWNAQWTTGDEWRKAANIQAAAVLKNIPAMQERLGVTVQPTTIGGVRAYIVTPDDIPPEHRDKVLVHIHGGCYELYPGESGTTEAMIMAGLGHYRVISVDYRMPPEAYFPAALDDVETVYKSVLSTHDSKNVGVFGTSAGGALVLELMLRLKYDGLPVPGAIAPGTPMSDLTKVGDSFYTNEKVDNVLVSRNGFCQAAADVYAHGHDLKDPLLSPVYGDMHGFPPAILTTGTRDLLLSNTVRVHQKLQQSGVEAQLEVFDGMSHAQYQMDDRVPEARAAFAEITQFFDKHLGH
ncbi:alpha/beta hydrolase [Paraburkholderia sp. J10-1]|uniref:alpha/beta hydrolase n=1 Tax=Paraburkholderia sp. J10-1 TaxID=2805430 RepID=UPI002AB65B41|nr:alpha/beta hydrolase [Paraburkholderia sp. J10-1]